MQKIDVWLIFTQFILHAFPLMRELRSEHKILAGKREWKRLLEYVCTDDIKLKLFLDK
jgi:hypothetical protein